jgi:putative membrane protein
MKETVNKDLILRERLALQNYISKSDYSFSFFSYCNVFFCCWFEYQKSIENWKHIVIEVSFYLIAFVILILGIVNLQATQDDYWKWKTHWRL